MTPTVEAQSIDTSHAVGVVETDLFCDACGFNLHTQKVWRDERLGLLVCRCPECGKHAAAGERTTATNAWLRRVALLGLLCWALLGIAFTLGTLLFAMGIHAAAEEGLTYRNHETRDGRNVTISYAPNAAGMVAPTYHTDPDKGAPTTVPVADVVLRRRLAPWLAGGSSDENQYRYGRPADLTTAIFVGTIMTAGWYACAVVLSCAAWFWRPGRRWLWLLLPVLAVTTVYFLEKQNQRSNQLYWGGVPVVNDVSSSHLFGVIALLSLVVMAIGIATGRPLARLLLSVFVPPKARQMFAFLWHCDGKTMPTPRSPGERPATLPIARAETIDR